MEASMYGGFLVSPQTRHPLILATETCENIAHKGSCTNLIETVPSHSSHCCVWNICPINWRSFPTSRNPIILEDRDQLRRQQLLVRRGFGVAVSTWQNWLNLSITSGSVSGPWESWFFGCGSQQLSEKNMTTVFKRCQINQKKSKFSDSVLRVLSL